MTSASRGYFVAGSTWLHARHPTTKLLALAFALLAGFLLPPIALVGLAVLLTLAAWSAGLVGPLAHSMRIPAFLLASIVVVNGLFIPGATDVLVPIGPVGLSRDGLTFGLVSAGRLFVAFLASVLFLFTTLADDLLEALVARGVGHRIAFVVLSAVQLVPLMQTRASAILEAQQARGLSISGSARRRVGALLPLIAPVLLGSLVDVRERTLALEARGFGARPGRTAYREVVDPPIDRVLRLALVAACVGVVVLALTGTPR